MRKPSEILEAFDPVDAMRADRPFFLVGIGGAGMGGLATMLHNRGIPVHGTDSTASATTAELEAKGIPVRIGHSGVGISKEDQVVLSDAIDLETSPEVAAARALGCPLFRRSQLLGWLLRGKKTIAVTGTHGKTTVTGMIGAGLRAAGMDPTIVVGANVPEFGGSVVEGQGEYAVVEACEAYNGFLDLDPFIAVLTNLEPDHLDFHGSYDQLLRSMRTFLCRVPEDGSVVFSASDPGAVQAVEGIRQAKFIDGNAASSVLAGRHNAQNAAAALAACIHAGAASQTASEGIRGFRGADRRLQVVRDFSETSLADMSGDPSRSGPHSNIAVVDDYAHHPTEVEASIQAQRERFPGHRLVVAFQPHLYSRTAEHIEGFAKALDLADRVVLTDIYPAREAPIPGISSARIAEAMAKAPDYVPARQLLPRFLAASARHGDVICMMGAGNIGDLVGDLVHELDRREPGRALRIAVVLGGDSAEREVSLHSGAAVLEALAELGHLAFPIDLAPLLLAKGDLGVLTGPNRPDLAFLAVHGTHAEDGAIQGLFELLHIPYTGSGIQASAMAMDKQLTRKILSRSKIDVAKGQIVRSASEAVRLKPPLVVKPNAQGSTVGLSFVTKQEELRPAIEKALRYDDAALVEEWLKGMEISVPVLGGKALLPVEIVPKTGKYDFSSKYTPGETEEICPARLGLSVVKNAQEIAVKVHEALGCEGATRTDMMVRGDEILVLEINTLPGLTPTSLLPKSAETAGIPFKGLVEWIVQDALRRHAAKA